MSEYPETNGAPLPYRTRAAGLGCVVAAIVVGGILGLGWSFAISLSMIEGGYRAVPQSQWWLVRAEMIIVLVSPVVIGVGASVLLAHRSIRRFVAVWGIGLGVLSGVFLILFTL